jgi:hypothetical protein
VKKRIPQGPNIIPSKHKAFGEQNQEIQHLQTSANKEALQKPWQHMFNTKCLISQLKMPKNLYIFLPPSNNSK